MNSEYLGVLQMRKHSWKWQTLYSSSFEKLGTFYLPKTENYELFSEISLTWDKDIVHLVLTIVNNENVWVMI